MVSDKLFQYSESSDNLVEYEVSGRLTITFNHRHRIRACFMNYSMSTIMWLCPPTKAGLQSINSSPHLVKGPVVTIGCKGARYKCILCTNTWQGWCFLTSLTQSLKIYSQKYPALNIFWAVESPDKWPPHALHGNHLLQAHPPHDLNNDIKWNLPHDGTMCYPLWGNY